MTRPHINHALVGTAGNAEGQADERTCDRTVTVGNAFGTEGLSSTTSPAGQPAGAFGEAAE